MFLHIQIPWTMKLNSEHKRNAKQYQLLLFFLSISMCNWRLILYWFSLLYSAKFALNTNRPNWETLALRRKLSRICALYKAYSGEGAWKTIGDRLQRPHYLSRVDHKKKIRTRGQRTDIGKYSFVNRTIQDWNQLPGTVFEQLPCTQMAFKKRARKEILEYH